MTPRSRTRAALGLINNLRTTPVLSDATHRLIREADTGALQRAGMARMVTAGLLLLAVVLTTAGIDLSNPMASKQIQAAELTLVLFGALGWAGAWLASKRIAIEKLPVITAILDAFLVLGNLAFSHWGVGIPGSLFAAFPVAWVVPITMAAAAIHYQPRLQAFVAAVYVIGLSLLAFSGDWISPAQRQQDLAEIEGLFSTQANVVRIVMVFAAALILILVARQGRLMLERAVRETTLRANLTRYLPSELAPILTDQAFASLRQGRRIPVTVMFVDIRASTTFGETMEPVQLAIFITSFRRRVLRAASRHGGVIDKFTGDGALILFGVPGAQDGDARRALACGRTLLTLIERWNAKRRFDPPVRLGIGIHTGDVFCGVVGDESRLEFTVVGETVNIASRIEQATKAADCELLASQETIVAAGEEDLWTEVECDPLPGVTRRMVLMKPVG
ncbi:adenylate/guanylate cyclase domain-containing protein [Microvirga sp. CF3062]|uniref:adenylate/guanylate cyclase domain-containing protein n=1 Tax=Microvirga sp. CF3062 TaxID=3110182 RepID=UPI002E7808CC|nr:adenylate/guanylate cyclase domain-containing protein [Microvirga sp. CF3062]MEE1656593.1 adenylate/guanylate cyclase domain-containing protein [Microvirga sp. CF3062]